MYVSDNTAEIHKQKLRVHVRACMHAHCWILCSSSISKWGIKSTL